MTFTIRNRWLLRLFGFASCPHGGVSANHRLWLRWLFTRNSP